MSALEVNKKVVYDFNKEFIEKGNTGIYNDIVDSNFINRTAPAGTSADREGVYQFIQALRNAFTDLKVEIYDQVAEEDRVVTRKAFHATHMHEFMGLLPSRQKVVISIIDIIRLRDGKYIEHWSVRDMNDVIAKSKQANP